MRSHLVKMFQTMHIEHFLQDLRSKIAMIEPLALALQRHRDASTKRLNRAFSSKKFASLKNTPLKKLSVGNYNFKNQ